MKKSIILCIKGFIMGLANIIPGVSGGTLAISLGIYDSLISTISNIFKNIKENLKFLIPIFLGIGIAIISLSHLISYTLDNYVLPTILFFIGTIAGGIPMLVKKINNHKIDIKDIIIFIVTFIFIIFLTLFNKDKVVSLDNLSITRIITLFIVGIIAAATMIIPGVSGSAVLMTLGYYGPIIDTIKDLTNFSNLSHNLLVLIPFGLGAVIGILLIAKLIEYLFKKYEIKTYYAILGFVISSIIAILIQNIFVPNFNFNIIHLLIGIILFGLGFGLAYKLGDK